MQLGEEDRRPLLVSNPHWQGRGASACPEGAGLGQDVDIGLGDRVAPATGTAAVGR
jgi:hypothetical protein